MFSLLGASALSQFRLDKLLQTLRSRDSRVLAVSSRFIHFVDAVRQFDESELELLGKLLTYGPRSHLQSERGQRHVVQDRVLLKQRDDLVRPRQAEMRAPLLHAYTPSLTQRCLKDLYYAELRARERHARGRTGSLWLVPMLFVVTFLKDYLLRLAVLDGGRGYVAAHLAASYSVYKRLRGYEMDVHPESIELAREALIRHGLERDGA